ncbi:CIS tube protein [Corallococcus sicarius]|uniref:Peptidoglycan-binding protein n=1 Tax=Corallococcus sicarius TaxID=2316726 RepID=A0A3A8NXK6_9BACT|nr:peptidoglycan-binding protein [Corallococcus sicarius]RKH46951.1 peptidoglycan-binding protein [Corallococcus sicarius]
MPEPTPLAKAELRQLDANFENEIEGDTWAKVQFNPETLKVSFANQVQTPSGGGDQRGTPARQFVGAGTTKLAVQLWFDVTGQPEGQSGAVDDVRQLTKKVAFFITPKKEGDKFVPPAVRFLWGSFQFDGIMESLEESLEFFSPEGKPLRASVSFGLTQQKITAFVFRPTDAPPPGAPRGPSGKPPGTSPMTPAPQGSTVQGLAAGQGKGGDWQSIASANGIENPRQLAAGQLIDLQVGVNIGVKR